MLHPPLTILDDISVQSNGLEDTYKQVFEKSGNFSTRFMYRQLLFRGIFQQKNATFVEK